MTGPIARTGASQSRFANTDNRGTSARLRTTRRVGFVASLGSQMLSGTTSHVAYGFVAGEGKNARTSPEFLKELDAGTPANELAYQHCTHTLSLLTHRAES
jgi:hypothetical protein